MCADKWSRNIFWGQGRDYDGAWGSERTDTNEFRRRLHYDIATRVQPMLSRRYRIVGGDAVAGIGIVHRTHPSYSSPSYSPSSSCYSGGRESFSSGSNYRYTKSSIESFDPMRNCYSRNSSPQPTEHYRRLVNPSARSSTYRTSRVTPTTYGNTTPSYHYSSTLNWRLINSLSPSVSRATPSYCDTVGPAMERVSTLSSPSYLGRERLSWSEPPPPPTSLQKQDQPYSLSPRPYQYCSYY